MKLIFGTSSYQELLFKTDLPVLINQLRGMRIVWKNETWVDSGGYQIGLYNLQISVEDILEKYKRYNAYAFFTLDIPSIFAPLDRKNFEYFEYLYTKMEYIERIIPVIHLYPVREVDEAIDFYKQYTDYMALGAIIASSKLRILIYTLPWFHYVRRYVKKLHLLGMAAPYFLNTFDLADSMDTASHLKTAGYREIFWFDGKRKYVGDMRENRITKEEEEQLFEFLDKTHFPFDYDFSDIKIIRMMNVWILRYHNWNIKNKYTEYSEKLKKMSLDDIIFEMIKNYKIASKIKEERLKGKKVKIEEEDLF